MSVTGEPDGLPQKVGVPIVDAAAAHLGAQAVLAALFGRERSGRRRDAGGVLLETALNLQAATWCEYLGGAPEPTRIGTASRTTRPPPSWCPRAMATSCCPRMPRSTGGAFAA
jgi:crotonobetainyl-CoA:carnitine CoA-transferase CaiB-like acyl-CoA transferase